MVAVVEIVYDEVSDLMYRVFFLTRPPLILLSVGRLVTNFKKTLESQTGPPEDKKKS